MIQWITCSVDRISRLTNAQIKYIIEQVKSKIITSHVNEISKIVATISTYNSDDNDDFDINQIHMMIALMTYKVRMLPHLRMTNLH